MDAAYKSPLDSPALRYAAVTKKGLRARIVSSSTKAEWPDPILELDRIIGFSNFYPRMLRWIPDGSACIYTSSSTIIVRELCEEGTAPCWSSNSRHISRGQAENDRSTGAVKGSVETAGSTIVSREHFLYGHSATICALAVTSDGSFLASAEVPTESKISGVRLWDLASRECITVVKAQPKGVHALNFSSLSSRRLLLCAVGRDECFRTQIFIWDCSYLQRGKEDAASAAAVSLMARQTSDFPIDRISFSPYEQQDHYHLVSCGRENVRYWRVNPNTGHLTGCPVILNEYSRGTVFTDIGFDTVVEAHPSDIRRVRPLYASSSLGTLLVIDYDLKQVLCVYQLHDASINCLSVNEGFCVTGSDDCFLRVWPLDFTDFFLEAQHEASVSCLDVSADGIRVLVGSRNNAIGILDIANQQYATLLRSHSKEITAMAPAPWRSPLASLLLEDAHTDHIGFAERELVTASGDGTLRVWDTTSGHQLYEFDIQQEHVTSLCVSPVNCGIVAAGFASGCTRIFAVHRASTVADGTGENSKDIKEVPSSMLREFRQHQSSILHIEFNTDGQYLYTSGTGKQLCLYDARQQDYLPLKMLLTDFDPDDGHFVLSHDNKWLSVVSTDRQSIVMLDPCSLRVMAAVRPPKQEGFSSHGKEETLKLVRFSKNSTELLVLSASDRLYVFSLPTRELKQSIPLLGQEGISALVVSENARYMATGGVDGSLQIWNWDDKGRICRMHQTFLGHAGKVNDLVFTNDGKNIVAIGESSAICVWQFHGDSSLISPRAAEEVSTTTHVRNNSNNNNTNDKNADEDNTDISAASMKPNFRLSLETDALKLGSGYDTTQGENLDSVLSNQTDLLNNNVPTTVVVTDCICGDLALSSAIGGGNTSNFIWSYSAGKLIYSMSSVLVVEDLASGQQVFHDDLFGNTIEKRCGDTATRAINDEIVLIQLSPSGKSIATISSRFDVVSVRSVASIEDDALSKEKCNFTMDTEHILIRLLPETCAVSALAFSQPSHESNVEELICIACVVEQQNRLHEYTVAIACTTQRAIIWFSSGLQSIKVRQIVPRSDFAFLLLSDERSSISVLTVHPDKAATSFDYAPKVELEPLIDVFPTKVQIIRLYSNKGEREQQRYLVGIDNDRYCYFYDFHSCAFIATTQLLLLPSKTKRGNNQDDRKLRGSCLSLRVVEYLEWVTSGGKSLLITGSRADNMLYVHGLSMLSTKHSARVQVDWQRVARAGVSLLCKIPLNGNGLLRSLSVDPARDVGIATTDDGITLFVHFDSPSTTKVLKETPTNGFGHTLPFVPSLASWALEGSVLLSTSQNDNAIRVWVPGLSREVARFQVDSSVCMCFAVNPFSTTASGISQSMVMAGYSDGSIRVFDLCDMRLLSRFKLTPLIATSGRFEGGSFDRIVFVGAFSALVVTKDNCVLLLDISNALGLTEEPSSSRITNSRPIPPKRPVIRQDKKSLQDKSRTKTKSRMPAGRTGAQEVAYRVLPLTPSNYNRRKRLPSLAKSEQMQVQVGAIDVMAASDATIHPFLVVVKYTDPARYGEGKCMVKVFAEPTMSVLREEKISLTDEWRFNTSSKLDKCVAVFTPASTHETVRVLYTCKPNQADNTHASGSLHWGFEIRDCMQCSITQRLALESSLSQPVLLRNIHALQTSERPEKREDFVLLADAEGHLALLDITQHRLISVNPGTAQKIGLAPCSSGIITKSSNGAALLLLSSSQLAVGNFTF
ncbi:unnamed protein product [Phytophthora lilii]|uniref:Unnamed protein product n=1 Tax=Phytophthora lilii TaxID=2077276 RepID=A0A9W6TP11_9STRA|nr:unnamed protein product [Phytophthora lilii]